MILEYLARFPRRFARHYCLTANTIRYVIEYRCIVRLISKSNHPFRRLIDVGAGSGEMSARLIEQGFAETAIAIEPDPRNFTAFTVHMLWFIIAPRDEKAGIARRREDLYNPLFQTEACRPGRAL
jgi:SAM-dependent methyltransferase